jgi:SAM-dependent methyltransferase
VLTVDFDRLRLQPGMVVLDAGCGQGRHSLEVLRRGAVPVALDLGLHDLQYTRYLLTSVARELAPDGTPNAPSAFAHALRAVLQPGRPAPAAPESPAPIQAAAPPAARFLVLKGNTLELPFATGSLDRVLCSEVLEHVLDPAAAAGELARVLKPGGWLAVSVPTPFSEHAFHFGSDDYFNSPGGHVRIFTPARLTRLLADQGLQLADLHCEHAFHTVYWWVRCVFGLHDEAHPMIRHFKKVLTHAMFSRVLTRAETVFDWVFPKSMVCYARKQP